MMANSIPTPQRTPKAKIGELDIVRALAILAVVLIHTTSEGSWYEKMGPSKTQFLYFFVNKMGGFAVPLFILVSGLVLFYVYIDNWNVKKLGSYYFKRVRSVVVPYVLWSFFYYVYDQWLAAPQHVAVDWPKFFSLLPWADAKYHLYFMVIIVQFYVLFPLLLWPARRYGWFRRTLPLWGLLVQGGFYTYGHWFHPLPYKAELCVTYFLLFTLGGWIGIHYGRVRAFCERHAVWLVPLGAAVGIVHTGLYILAQYNLASFENTWYELLWTLYGCVSAFSLIGLALWLQRRWAKLAETLTSLGIASFGVYLMHPWILSTWKARVAEPGSVLGFNLYYFAAFMLTLLVPWLATLAYKQAAVLFRGRPKPMRPSF
jgi:peptidoglycan/LPS O-acetylase OafA/YrhL